MLKYVKIIMAHFGICLQIYFYFIRYFVRSACVAGPSMSSLDVPALSDETNLLLKPRPCSTPKQNLVFRRVVLALAVLAAVSLALGGGYRRFRAQTTEA